MKNGETTAWRYMTWVSADLAMQSDTADMQSVAVSARSSSLHVLWPCRCHSVQNRALQARRYLPWAMAEVGSWRGAVDSSSVAAIKPARRFDVCLSGRDLQMTASES